MKTIKKITAILLSTLMLISALPLSGISANSASEEIVTAVDSTESVSIESETEVDPTEIDSTEGETEVSTEEVEITASGTCGENAEWKLDTDGTLTISGEGEMTAVSDTSVSELTKKVVIGDGITEIPEDAFELYKNLTEAYIGTGITRITLSFMYCSALEKITIPDTVTVIWEDAFYECHDLTIVCSRGSCAESFALRFNYKTSYTDGTIAAGDLGGFYWMIDAEGNFRIEGEGEMPAYSSNSGIGTPWDDYKESIKTVVIQEGITSIIDDAFNNCINLISVNIPEGITSIGASAFSNCENLADIVIPESVSSIGTYAFSSCNSIESITIPESLQVVEYGMFSGCEALKEVVISKGVDDINERAFRDCVLLEKITLPDTLTTIDNEAFVGCCALTEISIPDSVTQIQVQAFMNCTSLKEVKFNDISTERPFTLGWGAFYGCTALESITLPKATQLGSYVFYNCSSLKSIILPETGTSVSLALFSGCTSLESVTISADTVNIYADSFKDCSPLKYLRLNKKVTNIEESAFEGCTSLTISCSAGSYAESFAIENNIPYITEEIYIDSGSCGENVTWVLDDVNTLTVSGTGDMAEYTDHASVPWSEYAANIESVTVEEGITSICNYAFKDCSAVKGFNLASTVQSIGVSCFENCSAITSIKLPEGIKIIPENAFKNCTSLNPVVSVPGTTLFNYELQLPGSVTKIGDSAFEGCTALMRVSASGVTQIDSSAFADCSALHYVSVPGLVTTGASAFKNCTALQSIAGNSALEIIGTNAYEGCGLSGIITIPENVKEIGEGAFKNSNLQNIFLNANITEIADSAFEGCTYLANIGYADSITSIGNRAFYGCSALTTPLITEATVSIGASAYENCSALTWLTMYDAISYIGADAFKNCTALTFICNEGSYAERYAIENSIPYVHDVVGSGSCGENITWELKEGTLTVSGTGSMSDSLNAFNEYRKFIKTIVIGDGITSIDDRAFQDCYSLTSVTIPDSVTSIGAYAFYYCTDLPNISISNYVVSIGNYAFSGCHSLTLSCNEGSYTESYAIENSIPYEYSEMIIASGECGTNVTWTLNDKGTLILSGEGKMYTYSNTSFAPWNTDELSVNNAIIENGITEIAPYSFYNCTELQSVTIPESVTGIGSAAFMGCIGLTEVTIPKNVTSIGSFAFRDCTGLTDVSISESVTELGSYSFYGCTGLTSIIIPESVTSIGSYAFRNCSNLISATLPDNLTSIPSFMFYSCQSLTSIKIPDSVTSIGRSAFECCYSLESVNIPEGVTILDIGVFMYCTSLTDITIPATVTSIGESTFENCNILIYCYKDSYAEAYAIENNLNYELIKPYTTSDGVVLTIHGLEGVKDFLIAKGDYSTYREVKDNRIVLVTNAKFSDADEYTYWLSDYGLYTVYIRYTDSSKAPAVLKTELSGPIPELSPNGLQLTLGNLDGVKVIRTAYGDYDNAGDVKRAEGQRSVSGSRISGGEYIFQYRENGLVTIAVVYESGYTHIFKHEICKYVPEFVQEGNTVTISKLDELRVIRYAPGEYSSSSEIKRAEGCVNITPAKLNDGVACVTLEPGVYTFCVQYVDDSYNYYTVTVE